MKNHSRLPLPVHFARWILPLMLLSGHSVSGVDSATVKQLFADPPRAYATAPLWVWNDMLSEEQIRDTMRDLAGQQVRQVFVHPRPGLMTPYLSADWFRLWKVALDEAERLDMNVWIYDENSYPSGFAGGWVPEVMPESRGRGLHLRDEKTAPKWSEDLVGVYRIDGDDAENVTDKVRSGETLPEAQYVIAAIRRAGNSPWHGNRCYVDLLYSGVTEKFLEVTMEAYRREIGDQFGKRVPGVFTDEPNIRPAGGLPWTDDLPEQFQQRWGYSLLDSLPSLAKQVGDWRKVRHNYYQTLNELFVERWAKPRFEYCAKQGLEFTGHYWDHEWPNCGLVPDNMAMYAWHQRPAIDCLMNQYREDTHAQFGNVRMVRELASVANQLGMKRTLCEIYGAGGWDLRFEDMKRIGDWLGVLGVNTFDEHLSYITLRGARKRDHPQSFSYHEPWWEAYHVMASYLTRLSVALSQGEQVNPVLVLEPTTTAWMYQGHPHLKEIGDRFFNLLMKLEAAQIEYDLCCEDVLARWGSFGGNRLNVGKRSYTAVILPPHTENLNRQTLGVLQDYLRSGGTLLYGEPVGFVDGATRAGESFPQRAIKYSSDSPDSVLRANPAAIAPRGLKLLRPDDDQGILFHHRRQLDDGELLFLVNTSTAAPSTGIIESPRAGIERWNLATGEVEPYPYDAADKGVRARFDLPPSGSLLLFLSNEPVEPAPSIVQRTATIAATGPVEIRRVEPNVLTLDYVDITAGGETRKNLYVYQAGQFAFQKNGMERNPWDSAVQFKDELITKTFPANSGFQATYRFTVEGSVPRDLSLVIERPDLYSISCNGQAVAPETGAWWLDKAFGRIDLAAVAQVGQNTVTLQASPFTIYHELESAYVLGDFTLRATDKGFVITPSQALKLGAWNEQGLPFYSAGVAYSERFNLDRLAEQYVVTLPRWYGSVAKVLVNGQLAGYIASPPWECEVTEHLWRGANTVEVVAMGTLKNTLGPHHGKPGLGSAWPGMFHRGPEDGPPPGTEYSTVGYGLFAPFELKQVIRTP